MNTKKMKATKKSEGISDAAVQNATGKNWPEWFAILDAAGGKKLTHQEIVAYLSEHYQVGPWWRQMVTVEYERARGLREKYQVVGAYSVSRSKTIAVSLPKLYQAWREVKHRARWLQEKRIVVRTATPNKSMRITWVDGKTSISVNFYAKGENKSQIVVEHEKLATAAEAKRMQNYWSEKLEKLKQILEV
jgi:uncharacterized protein YndB with AHSA1/START domain